MKLNRCWVAATLALVLGGVLSAAVYPRYTAEELAERSQMIVQGNVVRSWTAWDSEHKYVWTHYEVSVTDAIRGPRSGSITVSEPGGSLDGIHQQFSGSIPYAPGESAVLFLYQTPIGYWRAVGGPQGKFTVEPDGRVRSGAQFAAYAEPAGRVTPGLSLDSLEGLTVADFKNRVRRLAAAHPFRIGR